MRNIGARHPNVQFAPDHFAGWSGSDDKAGMTAALEELATLPNAHLRYSSTSLGPYADLDDDGKDLFRRVIEAFTPRRMMWGSNFPSSRAGGFAGQVTLGKTALPWLSARRPGLDDGRSRRHLLADAEGAGRQLGGLQ